MNLYVELAVAALLPVAASALLCFLEQKTFWGKQKYLLRQIVTGIIFGLIAIYGTEHGVTTPDATYNVRDAAPIVAGLVFGAPAGIIAGLLGGIERAFAVLWGAGTYTAVACSVATAASGFIAAFARKRMFDDHKPSWYYGLVIGGAAEVFHLTLVFVTNLSDTRRAFGVVEKCAIPMILYCALSVAISVLIANAMTGRTAVRKKEERKLSERFQGRLLICVLIAFLSTSYFISAFQTGVSKTNARNLLDLNIADVEDAVTYASNENLLKIIRSVLFDIGQRGEKDLLKLCERYNISEINLVSAEGVITESTDPDYVGFDMASGEQSREFLKLLDGKNELVQAYGPITYDSSVWCKYAGVPYRDGFLQIADTADRFQPEIIAEIRKATLHRRIGETGALMIADISGTVISSEAGFLGKKVSEQGIDLSEKMNNVMQSVTFGDVRCQVMYRSVEGYTVIGYIPESETMLSRDVSVYLTIFMEYLIFAVLLGLVYALIKKLIISDLNEINGGLRKITDGDLNVEVNVRTNREFNSLSNDINATVGTLRRYISEAEARIDKELEFAKTIQSSSLPRVFPPYPNRRDFDIYASMVTAKEVGGDFYDFYLLGKDKLAVLVADVSGKGIPAAMFMMTAKTMIKSFAETGEDIGRVFENANNHLCENNEAGMFVTAWMGVLDLATGRLDYVNAGHNPPLIRRRGGGFEYFRTRPGFVLAGMDGIKYGTGTEKLAPGDTLYLYTDGVTEATDNNNELFGEDRLQKALNSLPTFTARSLCEEVKKEVDEFVDTAPQFDDITMLALRYLGSGKKEMTVEADLKNYPAMAEFLEETLAESGVPMKSSMQLSVVLDEMFTNISSYAYGEGKGNISVAVACDEKEHTAVMEFRDWGVPYNPLEREDPDITLALEDRPMGGLGIFMVKKLTDEQSYRREDGQNILTVLKHY